MNINHKIKEVGGRTTISRKFNELIKSVNWLLGIRSITGAMPGISESSTGPIITIPNQNQNIINGIDSIAFDGTNISLVNDTASPSSGKFYGVQSGSLGWFTPPSGGGGGLSNYALVSTSGSGTTSSGTYATGPISWPTPIRDTASFFNIGVDATKVTIPNTGIYIWGFSVQFQPQGTYSNWVSTKSFVTTFDLTNPAPVTHMTSNFQHVWPTTYDGNYAPFDPGFSYFGPLTAGTVTVLELSHSCPTSPNLTLNWILSFWIAQIA